MIPDRRRFLSFAGLSVLGAALLGSCGGSDAEAAERFPVRMSEAEWRRKLGPSAFAVLREAATERPFSSPLDDEHRAGLFACKGCDNPLYSSKTKFDSGTGWPSFWAPLKNAIVTRADHSLLMDRTEVLCRRCGGHLGHVFDDGPKPTGLRYCMNGLALRFRPA
ncbi:MAG TPA: peptide-methionine (R)-S-oxide reductase MsrB [Sphingomonas sp.]|nr:peptide-methionine (R)-S-oxide reductase MsrB [Sphingomonas sp.]